MHRAAAHCERISGRHTSHPSPVAAMKRSSIADPKSSNDPKLGLSQATGRSSSPPPPSPPLRRRPEEAPVRRRRRCCCCCRCCKELHDAPPLACDGDGCGGLSKSMELLAGDVSGSADGITEAAGMGGGVGVAGGWLNRKAVAPSAQRLPPAALAGRRSCDAGSSLSSRFCRRRCHRRSPRSP